MTERVPDIRGLLDRHLDDPECDSFVRAHELLVRVGPLPELPGTLLGPTVGVAASAKPTASSARNRR
jgi:hypothetical protein